MRGQGHADLLACGFTAWYCITILHTTVGCALLYEAGQKVFCLTYLSKREMDVHAFIFQHNNRFFKVQFTAISEFLDACKIERSE